MPIYEYRCQNGHNFEVKQSMSDDPLSACQACGAPVARVFHPVAVHFKGSGFYTTDYGRGRSGAAAEAGNGAGEGAEATSLTSKSDSKADSKAESKTDSAKPSSSAEGASKPSSSSSKKSGD
jgi:putative FmdB family regulatory protein